MTDNYPTRKKKRRGRVGRPHNNIVISARNGAKVTASTVCGDRRCGDKNATLRINSEDYSLQRTGVKNTANILYQHITECNNTWFSFKERIITNGIRTIREKYRLVRAQPKKGKEVLNQHICSPSKCEGTTPSNKRSSDNTKEQTTKIPPGKMSENHNALTHDTVEVKIENLKKVYDEHAKKSRKG